MTVLDGKMLCQLNLCQMTLTPEIDIGDQVAEVNYASSVDYGNQLEVVIIKMDPERLVCLHRLIVRIWETEHLSKEGKQGVVCHV